MAANQDPSLNPGITPEGGTDPALIEGIDLATRLHQIFVDRAVPPERIEALMESPAVRTGQIDVASRLRAEEATGTTELPRVKPPKRKPMNRRGGRSYNEGSDSEHDPNWTAPAPELSPEEIQRGKQVAKAITELHAQDKAVADYRGDIEEEDGNPNLGLARLRNQGFRPDPSTKGTSLVRTGPARVPFKDRRPSRKRFF